MLRVDAKTNSLTKGLTQNLFKIPFTRDKSMLFDGTDDVVSTNISVPDISSASMCYWVKRKSTGALLSGVSDGSRFYLGYSATTGQVWGGVGGTIQSNSGDEVPLDVWSHLALVADSGTISVYLNGVLQASKAHTGSTPTSTIHIGAPILSSGVSFTYADPAAIDEFAVFSSALTAREIDAIYNNGQPTNLSSYSTLAAWYRMGEGKDGTNVDGTQNLLFQGLPTTRGSELITNGDFSSSSGWTLDSNASVSGGKLVLASSTGISYQTVDLDNGAAYEVIFTIENLTSGTVKPYLNGTNGTVRSANGTYKEIVLAGSANTLVGINPSGSMQIDNFSVKKLTNVGTISGALIKDESTAESVPKQCKNLPSAGSAKSLSFDGTDDFATIPYQLPTTTFTVSQWIKINEDSDSSTAVYIWDSRDSTYNVANIFLPQKVSATEYKLRWWNAGDYRINNSTTYPIGLWQHVVLVKDGTTGTMYVDGEKLTSATTFSSPTNSPEITVGGRYAAPLNFAEADIDEVAIWDTVLDGDAVKALYNAGLPTPVTTKTGAYDIYRDNLKAYYKMGDASDPAADGTSNLLFDQTSPGVSAELLTNGDFSDASVPDTWTGSQGEDLAGWAAYGPGHTADAHVTITNGAARLQSDGTFVAIRQDVLSSGVGYKYSVDVTDVTSGSIQLFGGAVLLATINSTGTFSGYFKTTDSNPFYVKRASTPTDVTFDNVSVKQVNGHTGTITGATIQTEAPKAIYALPPVANTKSINFDGTNDHLVTQVEDTLATRYYSFWLKSSDTGHNPVFDHGASNVGAFHLNLSGNRPFIYLGNTAYRDFQENAKQDDGGWHHYVVFIDADITKARLFIDAEEQTANSTVSSGYANAYTSGLRIGRASDVYFQGSIDEFSIHEELDEEAIRALYNRGRPIDVSSGHGAYDLSDKALHWWRMGDATSPAADGTNDIIFQGLEFEGDEMFPTNPSSSDWASLSGFGWDGTTLSFTASSGATATAQYSFTLPVGQTFRLTVDIENDGTGNFYGRVGDGSNSLSLSSVTTGTYEVVHTVTESGANNTLFFIVNGGFSGSISNISLNRIRGQYIGPELTDNDPFVTGQWLGYSANVVTFPSTTTVRVERPTSGGSSQGAAADLTSGGILQSTPAAGTTLKISFDLNTDDSNVQAQIYNGSASSYTTGGSGSKTVFVTMTGNGFIRFVGLDSDKFVELTNLTVKEVGGAAVMTNMTTSDIQTDTPY